MKPITQDLALKASDSKARLRAQNAVQLQGTLGDKATGGEPPSQGIPALQAPPQQVQQQQQ
jgi:hypothetical protein